MAGKPSTNEHRGASSRLKPRKKADGQGLARAGRAEAHSYSEAYSTFTRRGDRAPFRSSTEEAWAALESLRAVTRLIGLTPSQTFDVVREFAGKGSVGARLYDALIGQAARVHDIPRILKRASRWQGRRPIPH